MGMDVYGQNPTSVAGEYFRASVWSWRPLATYIEMVAPEIASKCTYWQSNDGDGLNGEDSIALAHALDTEIDSGRAELYVKGRNKHLDNLPSEKCDYCENGVTTQAIADKYPAYQVHVGKTCIQCKGSGARRPYDTFYTLDVDRIQRFANFLRACGGFKIN